MSNLQMHLKVLLPSSVFADENGIRRIVVETPEGAVGFWPRRLDCVTSLLPGILTYQKDGAEENYVAVDEGVLVKTGADVFVSVRNAMGGADLGRLRAAVEREFLSLHERERSVRSVLARLESGFVRRFLEFHHE